EPEPNEAETLNRPYCLLPAAYCLASLLQISRILSFVSTSDGTSNDLPNHQNDRDLSRSPYHLIVWLQILQTLCSAVSAALEMHGRPRSDSREPSRAEDS